ncbi:MAG: sirohydrochlorin chelatase [Mycobacterium sp.]|nr:sirohydrochlorin chelatase [Mycobacterium sp.]
MNTLVLAAHGSRDPRSAANARAVADWLGRLRPLLDVHLAFCEFNSPGLVDVLASGTGLDGVVAPLLLANAYHARIDIPRQIVRCGVVVRQADVLGEDDRLVSVLHQRLAELGVSGLDHEVGVLVVAIGSSHPAANTRTAHVARKLAANTRWTGATTAFATGCGSSIAQAAHRLRRHGARHLVIAPWFLAPGRLTDQVQKYATQNGIPMAAPLGAHRLVAETVLDRFDAAVAGQVAA